MPFRICIAGLINDKRIGAAEGELTVLEDIDRYNDEIEDLLGCFMKVLPDTHIILWALMDDIKFPLKPGTVIKENITL